MGLLPEKDTHTIGFVKYSLQYVAIILTFVGVSLYVSGASLVFRLHLWCWREEGGVKILYSPLVSRAISPVSEEIDFVREV